ncbi:hypothetical protein HN011_006378 [Eciton burchellii]|nr:hypothetical protein HN011_006378 [Eciton burchellii]
MLALPSFKCDESHRDRSRNVCEAMSSRSRRGFNGKSHRGWSDIARLRAIHGRIREHSEHLCRDNPRTRTSRAPEAVGLGAELVLLFKIGIEVLSSRWADK